jgi:hypothetical protein
MLNPSLNFIFDFDLIFIENHFYPKLNFDPFYLSMRTLSLYLLFLGAKIAVLLNNLGGTTQMEMLILNKEILQWLGNILPFP